MALTPEQRSYVVRSVLRILRDVNRDQIIAALKQDVLEAEGEEPEEQLELDLVVLAVAEACRERLRQRKGEGEGEKARSEQPDRGAAGTPGGESSDP